MSVLAAAGVLTLSGCSSNASSSNSNSSSKSESAEAADQLASIQASGKLIVALEGAGMTVTRASDGKEVVNLFKNHPRDTYDLILMDIMMPNMCHV